MAKTIPEVIENSELELRNMTSSLSYSYSDGLGQVFEDLSVTAATWEADVKDRLGIERSLEIEVPPGASISYALTIALRGIQGTYANVPFDQSFAALPFKINLEKIMLTAWQKVVSIETAYAAR